MIRAIPAAFIWIERAVRIVGTACFAVLFALTVLQVTLRYAFGIAPAFTEEFARYALVWSVLAGSALAVRNGSHISVTFLVDLAPAWLRRAWWALLDIAHLALFVFLVWTGIDATLFAQGQTSAGLQIPLSYPYSGIPLFFAAAALMMVARWLDSLSATDHPE